MKNTAILIFALTSNSLIAQGLGFQINRIKTSGSGCPSPSSVITSIDPDQLGFEIAFNEYDVEIGPGINAIKNYKKCTLVLDVSYTKGFQYSIVDVTYTGFAKLEKYVTGKFKSRYSFAGSSLGPEFVSTFSGIFNDHFDLTDSVTINNTWSSCVVNAPLKIETEARLATQNTSASGLMAVRDIEGGFTHHYQLLARRCP